MASRSFAQIKRNPVKPAYGPVAHTRGAGSETGQDESGLLQSIESFFWPEVKFHPIKLRIFSSFVFSDYSL
jgi:hypothetical protein